MKNITVSVEDETYRPSRVKAAENGTSVSALMRDYLLALAQGWVVGSEFDRFSQLQDRTLEEIHARGTGLWATDNLPRSALHERDALPWHQCPDLCRQRPEKQETPSFTGSSHEDKHHRISPPDPVDAIKFRMEQMNLTRKDLEPCIGKRGRVSEILNRRWGFSLAIIRNLHSRLSIPLESLIGEA